MTRQEAIERATELRYLIGKVFILPNGETEQVKAVVAWEEPNGNWQPHVCFYNWAGKSAEDGEIVHMNAVEFTNKFLSSSSS